MQEKLSEISLILIGSTMIILILIALIVVSLFINQKRKFRHRQQLNELKYNFDQEILRAQIEIQAQTFATVSKELHDNVSNTISLALLNLNLLPKQQEVKEQKRMMDAQQFILEAKNAIKDYSWYINPENFSVQGLQRSISELIEKFNKSNTLKIQFVTSGTEFAIEAPLQIIIYRILQEALTNTAKHANSSLVEVILNYQENLLLLTIKDDGCGFDSKDWFGNVERKKSSGLKNMISRAKMIGASLSILSNFGEGTLLRLEYSLPIDSIKKGDIL